MHGLDLFSGIGGISTALASFGVRTVAYCEQDRYAQGVLLSRMQSGDIDRAPIWDDVRTLTKGLLPPIDIIYGGFPCQDISVAGLGKGLAGERSGLFYEIIRLTKETNPSFVFLENVPAIRTRGLREVIRAFTEIGYDCRWSCLSASSVGAPHKRERWFLLAHINGAEIRKAKEQEQKCKKQVLNRISMENGFNSNNNSKSKVIRQSSEWNEKIKYLWTMESDNWDDNASFFLRMGHGDKFRLHRVKCLGNSVVPQQVEKAFIKLTGIATRSESE